MNQALQILQPEDPEEANQIFYSDEDNIPGPEEGTPVQSPNFSFTKENSQNLLKKRSPAAPHRFKMRSVVQEIEEELSYNHNTKRRLANLIQFNKGFFENLQNLINQKLEEFDFDSLLLDFRQCSLTHRIDPSQFVSTGLDCVQRAIELESSKEKLKQEIYKMLSSETKGRILNTLKSYGGEFQSELNGLFVFKKRIKEKDKFQQMFLDKKNKSKVAKKLAKKIMGKMRTVPDIVGEELFFNIIKDFLKFCYKEKKYKNIAEICQKIVKLEKRFSPDPSLITSAYFYGFLSNYHLKQHEKSYIFFKTIATSILKPCSNSSSLKSSKLRFEPFFSRLSEAEMHGYIFSVIQMLSKFFASDSSQKIFFNKFKENFEKGKELVDEVMITQYMSCRSYEQVKRLCQAAKGVTGSARHNFYLGFVALMESTSRTSQNRLEKLKKAFEYFEKYKECSGEEKEAEVRYNFGRALTHVNLPEYALEQFEKSKLVAVQEKSDIGDVNDEGEWIREKNYKKEFFYEAAFNQVVWYKKMGLIDAEKSVMKDCLVIDNF